MNLQKKKRKKKSSAAKDKIFLSHGSIRLAVFLFLSCFYMEIVFKLSVETLHTGSSFVFLALFSLCVGLVVSGIILLLPKKAVQILIPFYLGVLFLIFVVEFLVYRQFKVAYDINTILNAATDALGGFGADIRRLIFCFDGISHIALFLLPLILWFVLREKIIGQFPQKSIWRGRKGQAVYVSLAHLAGGAACYGSALFLILYCGLHKDIYTNQYNFESAVMQFGLGEGLCLDIRNLASSKTSSPVFESMEVEFVQGTADTSSGDPLVSSKKETVSDSKTAVQAKEVASAQEAVILQEGSSSQSAKTAQEDETVTPVVYGQSVTSIDFAALADAGGNCADIDAYVSTLTPSSQNAYTGSFAGKNLILICAEAFSGSLIDPELTPTLYRLSTNGINFNDYYQQSIAGTTGGEYQLLFGLIPTSGGSSIKEITQNGTHTNMGALLNDKGYFGMAFHNSTYTYYDRHETHTKLGYSGGYMGVGNGLEELISPKWPASDLELIQETLPMYIDKQPFNIYYMTVSGHSVYAFGNNAMSRENKDAVDAWCAKNNLSYTEPVRAYIAANLELEKALDYLVETLEEKGIADDTVICIAPDHFPYGLDSDASLGNMPYLSELYGYPVNTYEERDRSRAIIWCGALEDNEPVIVDTPASSVDILPTLCNLFGVEWDSRLYVGRDVLSDALPLVFFGNYDWKTDLGHYSSSKNIFTPTDENAVIPEDYVKQISSIVRNKMTFSKSVLSHDYYTHVYDALSESE
ncbi:MAG: sulfatase-like hydrolase/transferase [Lachnospiraceae bacterium]|nr:sulfatase-like hydrolase/transferase [Lachnospiraceae bacterium]